MLALRRTWAVLVGVWVGAWTARVILDWVLGLAGTWVLVSILAAGAAGGGLAYVGEARRLTPMEPAQRRDTILGWGAGLGAIAAIACLFLPLPWGPIAAAAVLAMTTVGLRRIPRADA